MKKLFVICGIFALALLSCMSPIGIDGGGDGGNSGGDKKFLAQDTSANKSYGRITDIFNFTAKEKAPVVRVSGMVRLAGSAPLSELVITGPDNEWYIAREEGYKLHDLQYRTVTVEGEETIVELKLAYGMSGERRTLKNIKIIAIE